MAPRKPKADDKAAKDKKPATPKKGAPPAGKAKVANDQELASDRDVKRIRVEKDVPMSASTEEVQRMSLEHAKVTLKIQAINDEIAKYMSGHRKTLRDLRKEDLRLAQAINNNVVMKRVKCTEERIYTTMTIRWVDDNGTVLDTKPMPPEMVQKDWIDDLPDGERLEADEESEEEEEDE